MKTNDEVELRLRAWMEHAAPAREPADLVDRAVSRTADVGQRPAILVRTGLRERRFALPAASPAARWLLLALALLAATVAAVAIGSRVLFVNSVDSGPRLVYVLDSDVYVADEDGTEPVRILDGDPDAECGGPADFTEGDLVSADGRHIALQSSWNDTCPGAVSILDLDGQVIASVPGVGWDTAWAPDGTRFATWLNFYEPKVSIGVYGIDGTLESTLDGSMVSSGDYDPRWSVEGTSVVIPTWTDASGQLVVEEGMDYETYLASRPTVVRLPLQGGEPEVVPAEDPGSHRSVSYSADGTRAAFTIAGTGPRDPTTGLAVDPTSAQLVIAETHGTGSPVVLELERGVQVDDGWGPVRPLWSPGNDRIALVVRRYAGERQLTASLRVIDLATMLSATVADLEGEGNLTPLAFSPDGERILVRTYAADGTTTLSSVNADGSGTTVLVEGADAGAWFVPQPDADDEMPP